MTCLYCERVHGCKDARVAHTCDSFAYTSLLSSRDALTNIVGESAAIIALRKQKAMATPEHPNTALIKELVNTNNIDGLRALQDDQNIQLPYLVMAASHLTGDSTQIGAMLRAEKDKRAALINLLITISNETATNGADVAEPAEVVVEDEPEEAPKKRRKRRTKAEIEADEAGEENEAKTAEDAPVHAPALNVDFDRAFNDILSAIAESQNAHTAALESALKLAKAEAREAATRHEELVDRVARLSSALIALEQQLMTTGMVLEPAVSDCFES
jgi:hypothetical protein